MRRMPRETPKQATNNPCRHLTPRRMTQPDPRVGLNAPDSQQTRSPRPRAEARTTERPEKQQPVAMPPVRTWETPMFMFTRRQPARASHPKTRWVRVDWRTSTGELRVSRRPWAAYPAVTRGPRRPYGEARPRRLATRAPDPLLRSNPKVSPAQSQSRGRVCQSPLPRQQTLTP